MKRATTTYRRMTHVAEKYLELLAAEGYRPRRESEERGADIVFKSEGGLYRLSVDEVDQDFLSLSLCYSLDEGLPMDRQLHLANAGNEHWKVVKITVHPAGEAVRFQFEAFGRLTSELLHRALHILQEAARRFFGELRDWMPPKALA